MKRWSSVTDQSSFTGKTFHFINNLIKVLSFYQGKSQLLHCVLLELCVEFILISFLFDFVLSLLYF